MKLKIVLIIFFSFVLPQVFSQNNVVSYFSDLEHIERIKKINKDLPVFFNQMCLSGYFTMPSAHMAKSGNVVLGYSQSYPYQVLGTNFQYFNNLEIAANFWIFQNLKESCFGSKGFGNDADRVANIKLSFLKEGAGQETLPEMAIGINDFMGSKRFHSKYVVITYQIPDCCLEYSLGWARGRMNGFFSGFRYFPFFTYENFFKNFAILGEYDANDYKNHIKEHPKGKKSNFPINLGVNFQFLKLFQATISSLRGKKIAGSIFANYNLGKSQGLFVKNLNPSISNNFYDQEEKKEKTKFKKIEKIFKKQGFDLIKSYVFFDKQNKKCLKLKIVNLQYRNRKELKEKVRDILLADLLDNYYNIVVAIEVKGVCSHEIQFKNKYLKAFKKKKMGCFEIDALCYLRDKNSITEKIDKKILYEKKRKMLNFSFQPQINMFFGSCKGKVKADGGFLLKQTGYVFNQIYYTAQGSYLSKANCHQVGSKDKYNPSQIINVRSDFVKYLQKTSFHLDNFYLQKIWNLNSGFFCKAALGYFELAYGGAALDLLYYPIDKNIAFSLDFANVYKRNYKGLAFQKKIRRWQGNEEVYEKYIGFQYFFNIFLEMKNLNLSLKASIGQFLAKDKGVRFELFRQFQNGLEVSTWFTITNGHDIINNKIYFDKGFSVSLPLDFFMNKSYRKKLKFKMSDWLRDVGAQAKIGKNLYETIHEERYFP